MGWSLWLKWGQVLPRGGTGLRYDGWMRLAIAQSMDLQCNSIMRIRHLEYSHTCENSNLFSCKGLRLLA